MVAMENPTCIARLAKFKAVAVATQPRFHDIHDLNEVNTVAQQRVKKHLTKGGSLRL